MFLGQGASLLIGPNDMVLNAKLISDFLAYLEKDKKRSWRTVRNYDFYLGRFLQWCKIKNISDVEKLTSKVVKEYSIWLGGLERRGLRGVIKKSTQNYHLIALRAFLRYLRVKKINSLEAQSVELFATRPAPLPCLEPSDWAKILTALEKGERPMIIRARDRSILEILYASGLKVSEIASLNRNQFDLGAGQLNLSLKRKLNLSQQAKYWLKQYLKLRRDHNPYLFIGHDRADQGATRQAELKSLTSRSLERLVQGYARLAGLKKRVTPQVLRHSYAQRLLAKGEKLETVRKRLGHGSLFTTRRYLKNVEK